MILPFCLALLRTKVICSFKFKSENLIRLFNLGFCKLQQQFFEHFSIDSAQTKAKYNWNLSTTDTVISKSCCTNIFPPFVKSYVRVKNRKISYYIIRKVPKETTGFSRLQVVATVQGSLFSERNSKYINVSFYCSR